MVDHLAERAPAVLDGRLAEILDAVDSGITVQDANLRLVYVNRAAALLSGWATPEEMLSSPVAATLERFELIDESGAPLSLAALPGRRALAGEEPEPLVVGFRIKATGEERWSTVRARRILSEADGSVLAISTFHDLTEQVRAERASVALLDSERQFRDLTDSAPMLVWIAGLDGRRTFFNRGWLSFTGRSLEEESGDRWIDAIHPRDVDATVVAFRTAFERRERVEVEYRLRRHDDAYRWLLDIGVPRFGPDGEFTGFVGSSIDIEERKRAADLARLMADAGLRLDEVRDLASTVEAAAAVAIPAIADWCVIDLVEPGGYLRRATAVAGDPGQQAIVDRIRDHPTAMDSRRPAARAVAERRAILIEDLRDEAELARQTADGNELAAIIRATGARSAIVQPLIARGETIGAIFFVVGPDRSYSEAELPITAELAVRLALAISNGQINAAELDAREAAEAAAERVSRLQRVTRELAGAASRDTVADLVVREGRAAIGASGAVVMVLQEGQLSFVAADGYAPERVAPFATISTSANLPLARAARESAPVWLSDIRAGDGGDDDGAVLRASPNRSACAVPLIADGVTFGVLGLSFAEPTDFDDETRAMIGAYADLCAQALARVALTGIRERLVTDLEAERSRLEALLQQLPEGLMIAEAPSGRIVLTNDRLEEILGIPRSKLHHIAGGEAYRGFDTDGRELRPEDWPLSRAVHGETVEYAELRLTRPDGSTIWVAKRARPIRDREGRVIAGVATIIDISAARQARENRQFLSNAAEVLGSSLDYEETIRRVAELAVPTIADWCAVDVVDESGMPRRLAVAHQDPAKIEIARLIQERYPSDPDAPRGLNYVLRTGQSDMMSDIPDDLFEAGAKDAEHLAMIRALHLRSYICVPIIDRGEVLGALTIVGAESGRTYGPDDLVFAESLAARAASAISNARSFSEAVRYKRILDATLDAVVMFDPVSLRISYANQGATDQLGYSFEELMGAEATILVEELDAIGLRGLVAPLVRGDLDARTATMSYRHRDGRTIPVEVLLQHVAPPGEPARIVAVARDIADRIEAQANLRRLAESEHARAAELNAVIRAMGDGIFVCAPDGRISLSNPAAEELFPNVTERTYADVLAQLDDPAGDAPVLGQAGGPVELRARGDEERWIELSTYPVIHDADAPEADGETILLLRDVTMARQRQAIRDTFIGVLSHELRTPVTTIFAGAKVLARETEQLPAATRRDIFEDIVVESERLHRLVEDVIAMTRFGEDEGEVGTEPVLLQRVLPVVVRSEEPRWPGVVFAVDLPAGLPTAVADPTYVEQVVRNLLSNAAKYGGPGTTVTVSVRADEHEIVVSVSDDGPGFPAEEVDRVFDLFFRSERTSAAAAGAGIGLFVCARLIRAMGGRIWAEPGPDGGATFTFTLQVMAEEE